MDIRPSPSSSSPDPGCNLNVSPGDAAGNNDSIHTWWESVSKARSRVLDLSSILSSSSSSLSTLADSDRPARSLLSSPEAYAEISTAFSTPASGSGSDPLCQWLYDTFQSSDPDLCLVVISFIPLVSGIYLSRIVSRPDPSPSLAGFEAVLLSIYASEAKSRGGMPVRITIPDMSVPSIYHTLKSVQSDASTESKPSVCVVSLPLEPQIAMKSTKRACVIGVALDCYCDQISQIPSWSKVDLCKFAAAWAGQTCPCRKEFDDIDTDETRVEIENVVKEMDRMGISHECNDHGNFESRDLRIPLPWELLRPILRILGHCLLAPLNSQDVKDAASMAIRCLYARSSHDLMPQAILATRSLIQLDRRSRIAALTQTASSASSSNTPRKSKEPPEILLASK